MAALQIFCHPESFSNLLAQLVVVPGFSQEFVDGAAIGPEDFHGCVFYADFTSQDRSNWFLDRITEHFASVKPVGVRCDPDERRERRRLMREFLARIHAHYRIGNRNFVKPGVAEATRVLLRRLPDVLLLRDPDHPDVEHLRLLATGLC